MAAQPHDNVPVRRLRHRRDSAPVPTELIDAGNPIAVAFHASCVLADTDVTTPADLGRYWGVGRRPTKQAKDLLVEHGLWIEVRPPRPGGGWGYEIRTVESRCTERDLVELAMEYPARTRIETAGKSWKITAEGHLVTSSGRQVLSTSDLATDSGREVGVCAGQDLNADSGHQVGDLATDSGREVGVCAGQDLNADSGHQVGGAYIEDPSGISGGEIPEGGSAAPPRSARQATPRSDAGEPDWARSLVRRLPWVAKGRKLSRAEAGKLAAAFRSAVDQYGLSRQEVQQRALEALAAADPKRSPVSYVLGAFEPHRLELEPLANEPLALPDLNAPENASDRSAGERMRPSGGSSAAEWGSGRESESQGSISVKTQVAHGVSEGQAERQGDPAEAAAAGAAVLANFRRMREEQLRAQVRDRTAG